MSYHRSSFVRLSTVSLMSAVLAACGGGGGGLGAGPGGGGSFTVGGTPVKGPMSGADVAAYAFDASAADFKGALIDTGTTNGQAQITGLNIPNTHTGLVILEITANGSTVDIFTGAAPAIGTVRTVVANDVIAAGTPIYPSPLTSLAYGMAVDNADNAGNGFSGDADGTATEAEFLAAFDVASARAASAFGFGMDEDTDLNTTPPLLTADTDTSEERAAAAAYRTAIEAFSAIVVNIQDEAETNNAGTTSTPESLIEALADDLGDGAIDGQADGQDIDAFDDVAGSGDAGTAILAEVTVDPSTLNVPGTTTPVTSIEEVLVEEAEDTGVAEPGRTEEEKEAEAQAIADDKEPVEQADPDPDSDGDEVPDSTDNCSAVANANQADLDQDGVGDACDGDRDGDDVTNDSDVFPDDPSESADTDEDTIGDNADNCPVTANTDQEDLNENSVGDACEAAPTATASSDSVQEDGVLDDGSLSGSDEQSDELSFALAQNASNGSAQVNSDGSFTYTPNANFAGNDSFSFTVNDGQETSAPATVSITVSAVNDAPSATAQTISASSGIAVNGTVQGSDIEGDTLSFALATQAGNGTAQVNADGSFTYTSNPGFTGQDSFSFTANDGSANSDPATVTVNVADNAAPTANASSATTDEDTAASGNLSGDDLEGATLTFSLVTQASNGSAVVNNDGSFSYTPNANFNGDDSFSFKVNDGNSDSAPATVSLTITPVNDAPTADAASTSTLENTPVQGQLSGSDIDEDGLSFALASQANSGTAVVNGDGSYTYTPNNGFSGSDSFTFTVNDGSVDSAAATVTITVADNLPPTANADSGSVDEDGSLQDSVSGSDPEDDDLSFSVSTQPSNGGVQMNADGSFTYTPSANFNGNDSFGFVANDGNSNSSEAIFSITVNAVNDAPSANAQSISVIENGSANGDVSGTDIDGDTLTFALDTQASNGVAVVNSDGSFSYTPNAAYTGPDSFSFVANDGTVDSAPATVSITVSNNQSPSATADSGSVDEDGSLQDSVTGSDPENDALSFSVSTEPSDGAVSMNEDGSFTYTPDANFNGSDSFGFVANDGSSNSSEALYSIAVNAVNDAPTISGTPSTSATVDSAYSFTPEADDVDAGDTLSFSATGLPGWLTIDSQSGELSGTPGESDIGPTGNIVVSVSDGPLSASLPAFSVSVAAAPDVPTGFNTGLFELRFAGNDSATFSNFEILQETGMYDVPGGSASPVDIGFGPFSTLAEASLSQDGSGTYELDWGVGEPDDEIETDSFMRDSSGVLYSLSLAEIEIEAGEEGDEGSADLVQEPSLRLLPMGDDALSLALGEFGESYGLAGDGEDAYLDGSSAASWNSAGFAIELAARVSESFSLSELEGDYGIVSFNVELEANGSIGAGAAVEERSFADDGSSTAATAFVDELMFWDAADDTLSTEQDTELGGPINLSLDGSTGLLGISCLVGGVDECSNISGFASPNGEMLVFQEAAETEESGATTEGVNALVVGLRRPASDITPSGGFRLNAMGLAREDGSDASELFMLKEALLTLNSGGACTLNLRPGLDLYSVSRNSDAGTVDSEGLNEGDSGVDSPNCSWTNGTRGRLSVNIEDLSFEGFISESGDQLAMSGFLNGGADATSERWILVGAPAPSFAGFDDRRPTIEITSDDETMQAGELSPIGLTAEVNDPDGDNNSLSVSWFASTGEFSSESGLTTSWTPPEGESGTTLLFASVDDGNRSSVDAFTVSFGGSGLPAPEGGIQAQAFGDLDHFLYGDDISFFFLDINPLDAIDDDVSCDSGTAVIDTGTTNTEEPQNGDVVSVTFNDCEMGGDFVDGLATFTFQTYSVDEVEQTAEVSWISDINIDVDEGDEVVNLDGVFTVAANFDDAVGDETFVISSASGSAGNMVATIDILDEAADADTEVIEEGEVLTIVGGFSLTLNVYDIEDEYDLSGSYNFQIHEIEDDVISPLVAEFSFMSMDDLEGPRDGDEFSNAFAGSFTIDFTTHPDATRKYQVFVNEDDNEAVSLEVLIDEGRNGSFDSSFTTTWEQLDQGVDDASPASFIDQAAISVDGSSADWSGVSSGGGDAGSDQQNAGSAATDLTDLRVAVNAAGTELSFLLSVSGNITFPHTPSAAFSHYHIFLHSFADGGCQIPTGLFVINDFTSSGDGTRFVQLDEYDTENTSQGTTLLGSNWASAGSNYEIRVPLSELPSDLYFRLSGNTVADPGTEMELDFDDLEIEDACFQLADDEV